MRLTETTERFSNYSPSFKGKKNGIRFDISLWEYGNKEWCVCAELVKDEDICYNTLWNGLSFKTLEAAVEWCENLKQDKLIELRENYFKKQK